MFYLSSFCCICLDDGEELHSLKNTDTDNVQLVEKLKFCQFGTDWIDQDVLVFICSPCYRNLNVAYELKKICLKNNERIVGYISDIEGTTITQNITTIPTNQQLIPSNEPSQAITPLQPINKDLDPNFRQYFEKKEPTILYYHDKPDLSLPGLPIPEEYPLIPAQGEEPASELIKDEFLVAKDEFMTANLENDFHESSYSEQETQEVVKREIYKCRLCNAKYAKKILLAIHFNTHKPKRKHVKPTFKCHICDKAFFTNDGSKWHDKTHIEKTPHRCATCGRRFVELTTLKDHIYKHNKIRNHTCNICNKFFCLSSTLLKHLSIHKGGPMLHYCTVCPKSFSEKSTLKKHIALHYAIKPHQCPHCVKKFVKKSNLDKHILTHTARMPHCCTECDMRFSHKNALKRHLSMHTDDHLCSSCEKYFAKSTFDTHILKHKQKSHVCTLCCKTFTKKFGLNDHISNHNERVYYERLDTVSNDDDDNMWRLYPFGE